jgi:MOSC domain-containing protein YiiM
MSTVHRDGVAFEVTFGRDGAVRLRERAAGGTVDHGEVCRYERIETPRHVFVQFYDGIFPPRAPDYLPYPPGSQASRSDGPGHVVDRWLAARNQPPRSEPLPGSERAAAAGGCSGTVEAVCVGAVSEIGAGDTTSRSAFVKTPVQGRVELGPVGFAGDEHEYKDHGGPDFAVLAYPHEHYAHWRQMGLELPAAGAMGENLTVSGLVETEVRIGDVFAAGGSAIQVTEPRSPCRKIAVRYGREGLAAAMRECGFTGFLFRVLVCGGVAAGDTLRLQRRDPHHAMTVAEAGRILDVDRGDLDAARRLFAVPALGYSARRRLARRLM